MPVAAHRGPASFSQTALFFCKFRESSQSARKQHQRLHVFLTGADAGKCIDHTVCWMMVTSLDTHMPGAPWPSAFSI